MQKLCHFFTSTNCILSISIPLSPFFRHKDKKHVVSHVEGVSKLDSITCRNVACRASMPETAYKVFNINSLFDQIVEDVSK